MSAACVSKAEFSVILKTVQAALGAEDANTVADLTCETLVDAYHVHPREHAIACMEDAEAALPQADVLKERYGANVVLCAIFYWVCQLKEVRYLDSNLRASPQLRCAGTLRAGAIPPSSLFDKPEDV